MIINVSKDIKYEFGNDKFVGFLFILKKIHVVECFKSNDEAEEIKLLRSTCIWK